MDRFHVVHFSKKTARPYAVMGPARAGGMPFGFVWASFHDVMDAEAYASARHAGMPHGAALLAAQRGRLAPVEPVEPVELTV